MRLEIGEARALVRDCMRAVGYAPDEAEAIMDHIVDAELRGVRFGGLGRALSVVERTLKAPGPRRPVEVTRETPVSALLDGGDQPGYLVARRATEIAMAKAAEQGLGLCGAHNTWYSGMFSYYMEMATREGLVAMAVAGSDWRVAPHGSSEARFGTNPIAFGFPSEGDPVILDFGTSSIMVGEAVLAARQGRPLPEGAAFDPEGHPTLDPERALEGAFTVWGEHKGSGLALVVQLLGLLCQAAVQPPVLSDSSFFIVALRPDLLMPREDYRQRVSEYAEAVRGARPLDPERPVRVPFERSLAERRARLEAGWIEIPDALHTRLTDVRDRGPAALPDLVPGTHGGVAF